MSGREGISACGQAPRLKPISVKYGGGVLERARARDDVLEQQVGQDRPDEQRDQREDPRFARSAKQQKKYGDGNKNRPAVPEQAYGSQNGRKEPSRRHAQIVRQPRDGRVEHVDEVHAPPSRSRRGRRPRADSIFINCAARTELYPAAPIAALPL